MKAAALQFFLVLGIITIWPLTNLAQTTKVYDNFRTLTDPDGVVYTYNMVGDLEAADPTRPVPEALKKANPDFCKAVSKDWISYAILHQLTKDKDLRDSARKIIDQAEYAFMRDKPFSRVFGDLCKVSNEITFGSGYYTFCPPWATGGRKTNDLHFTGSGYKDTTFAYQIHINTKKGRIFIAEKLNGRVLEVNETYIGKVWFEKDYESWYENPYPNPPRDLDCEYDPYSPPTAIITADKTEGKTPLTVNFKGDNSYDNDQDSQLIKVYKWNFGDGGTSDEENPSYTFVKAGTFDVILTVTDNEGDTAMTNQPIVVAQGETPTPRGPDTTTIARKPDPCPPCPECTPVVIQPDSCWMMYYRVQNCEGRIDTLEKTPIRVQCPAPPAPKVVMTTCCCGNNDSVTVVIPKEPEPRIELAGGAVFKRYRGQLPEYGLGATGQIRYRFTNDRRWAGFVDLSVIPVRRATPLDDRPFRWSSLRDSIDTETGLPLVWFRGTSRGTANLAAGVEFKPWRRIFIQGMGGVQRTFQQAEESDPRKDPFNQFKGFDLEIFYGEFRVGFRSTHLEIFFAYQLLQENEPFTRIPANTQGGTFTPNTDKSYNAGVQILF
ncbi:MAG: PKD domain-containing protein [Bacteroidia bacterium]|nr:PKD domain-containing protein [Bacteroidia bacterium]